MPDIHQPPHIGVGGPLGSACDGRRPSSVVSFGSVVFP
jgi:hypothetical protein